MPHDRLIPVLCCYTARGKDRVTAKTIHFYDAKMIHVMHSAEIPMEFELSMQAEQRGWNFYRSNPRPVAWKLETYLTPYGKARF